MIDNEYRLIFIILLIKTELKKEQFIRKIKSGLGEHIKKNGGKVNKVKKSKIRKFWERFMDIF